MNGIKALRDHVEDAGKLQVVPQGGVEGRGQALGLRIAGRQLEVGHRQADLLHTEPGTSADPILREYVGGGEQQEPEQNCNESFGHH